MVQELSVDELFILTICHDPAARLCSYQLLSEYLNENSVMKAKNVNKITYRIV